MDIIDALTGEHGALYTLCDAVEAELSRATDGGTIEAVGRLFAEMLQSHLAIEDALLCAPLEHVRRQLAGGCDMSHEETDRALRELIEAKTANEARSAILGAIGLARRHSAGQEEWMFPEARRHLPSAVRMRQGAEWAARRGVREPVGGALPG